ncbi:MAG: HypC/HybG/HupF family hydrogenase formation chaperone [Planctomycetota bacterium]|nr:MAG: HypC/HybG/HupF family hydrogenase formation chaperone [Planctomycetota bacterium]
MCLAVPAKVIEISGSGGTVSVRGNNFQADFAMLEDVKLGDFVLVHAGFAIKKYDTEEAREVLKLWKEIEEKT